MLSLSFTCNLLIFAGIEKDEILVTDIRISHESVFTLCDLSGKKKVVTLLK